MLSRVVVVGRGAQRRARRRPRRVSAPSVSRPAPSRRPLSASGTRGIPSSDAASGGAAPGAARGGSGTSSGGGRGGSTTGGGGGSGGGAGATTAPAGSAGVGVGLLVAGPPTGTPVETTVPPPATAKTTCT